MLRKLFPPKSVAMAQAPETLFERAQHLGVLRASLYLYREERFFLSAVQDFQEYLEPIELPAHVDEATLGNALIDRLRAFDPDSPTQVGGTRDWRVLQVSKARSAKAFNAQALFVHVYTHNAGLVFQACPRDSKHETLYAGAMLGLSDPAERMGATIRELLQAVRDLRAAGRF